MLYKKSNPVGLDVTIDKLQRELFEGLIKIGWRDYDSFPRIYRNKKGDDTTPETYLDCGEYKEVLFSDKKTVNSFFLADDKRPYDNQEGRWSCGVAMIVQANTAKLYCKEAGRLDERVIDDVRIATRNTCWDYYLKQAITGVDEVYRSLKVSYDKKEFDNMNNFCLVRLDFDLFYSNSVPTRAIK